MSSFFSGTFTQNIWGRVSIDVIAIIATIFGIATSLGLGANQINSGLGYMQILEESFITTLGIVVVITLMGLTSVVLGLKVGIKRLSQLNMILCVILLSIIFLGGPTSYILDGLVQNLGSYLQNLLSLSTNTNSYLDSSCLLYTSPSPRDEL